MRPMETLKRHSEETRGVRAVEDGRNWGPVRAIDGAGGEEGRVSQGQGQRGLDWCLRSGVKGG